MFTLLSFILVQKPAPVSDINVTPSNTSAQVTLGDPAPQTSSYIKYYYVSLGQQHNQSFEVDRQKDGTKFNIHGLKPNTKYTVTIWVKDGYSQWTSEKSKEFMTSEAQRSEAGK